MVKVLHERVETSGKLCGIPSCAVRCLALHKVPISLTQNSTGRKVSLLNDDSHTAAVLPRLPPLSVYYRPTHSPSPSLASSTPSVSPQTPRLVRSESSDSRGLPPSPLTPPPTSFDHLHHSKSAHSNYFIGPASFAKMDDTTSSVYPPVPDAQAVAPYPMSASQVASSTAPAMSQPMAPSYRNSNSPVSESSRAAPAANKASTKKNQYPCPLAKVYNCSDFFTTSGHAARHAKKHTGKKDAFCPECNKAFTRKDNMEQHRRTHQNVRGPSKSSTDGRVKKSTKPAPRKSVSGPLEAAAVAQLEDHQSQHQQLPQHQHQFPSQVIMSTSPYYINPDPIQPLPQPILSDFNTRPPYHRSNYPSSLDYLPAQASLVHDPDLQYSYPSPGLSNGLDTLALAASDHRRMSGEDSC
ncbi:unnamed protein product [Aureobasidium uvarum]|uniref:C2H2 type master regulator of conidiophore development brlA n=1 Tax=Aureobasidium uvarum TaxID=2773716 RepID=A0A9N8KP99_9PEZI|nr:unnamed protein product [Aureobasidium uvarum]